MLDNKKLILTEFIKSNLKYEFVDGEIFTPQYGERDTLKDVILKWRLKKAIKRINSHLNVECIDESVKYIIETGDSKDSLININSKLNDAIVNSNYIIQTDLEHTSNHKYENVKFIDWENIEQNEFLLVKGFQVQGISKIIELDMVVFINGIPVVVLECKTSGKSDYIRQACLQLNKYINESKKMFSTNFFTGVLNIKDLYLGTICSNMNQYVKWGEPFNDYDNSLKVILEKNYLLDFAKNFIFYNNNNKYISEYHQFNTVTKVINRLMSGEDNKSRGGLIYYPIGVGKAFTMSLLAKKIMSTKELSNSTIVIVTDRNDLSEQLYQRFMTSILNTVDILQPHSINELKELISYSTAKIILTTIQKFRGLDELQSINEDSNFIVLVYDAGRFQTGRMALNMRISLSNAVYIGFTSVPDNEIKAVFGEYIDKFSIENVA